MACLDIVLVKVFPYEGIPEITLDFVTPEEKHEKGSPSLVEEMELKYKESFAGTFFNQKLHSYNDEYAWYDTCDNVCEKRWYRYGKIHRENGPAIIEQDSHSELRVWVRNGQPYRENGLSNYEYIKYFTLKSLEDEPYCFTLRNETCVCARDNRKI